MDEDTGRDLFNNQIKSDEIDSILAEVQLVL